MHKVNYLLATTFIATIFLIGCVPLEPTLSEKTESLAAACIQGCNVEDQTVQMNLPADSTIYTTAQTICIKNENKLFCKACDCDSLEETTLIELETSGEVTCTFNTNTQACTQ